MLFILPGALAIMGLSWVYAGWGHVGLVAGLFFGLKAAVIAVVLQAVLRIGKRALTSRALIGIAALAFVAIFFFAVPFPIIVARCRPGRLAGRPVRLHPVPGRRSRRPRREGVWTTPKVCWVPSCQRTRGRP